MRREHAASKAPLPAGYGVIWSAVALDLVGFGIVLPILPLYAERFGASPSVIGLVLAAYSVGQLVGAPILGRLSDRYGRKPVLLLALAGSSLGHLVTGLAGSVWVVLAARAVDGLSGGSVSVAQAAVADLAPPAARARLFGLLGVAFAVGFVVGPALGSLAALGGPRLPFFLAAGLSGLNALTGLRRLPETRPAGAAPAGSAGAARPSPWAALARMGRRDRLGRLVLVAFLGAVAFSAFEATFSLLGARRVGLTIASAGLVFAAVGLLLAVVQGALVGRAVAAFGEARVLRVGLLANLAGLVLLAPSAGWATLAPAVGLLTLGQGLLTPALSSAVSASAPPAERGAVMGVQQSAAAAARLVGPAAALAVFDVAGPAWLYLLGAALMALALALASRA